MNVATSVSKSTRRYLLLLDLNGTLLLRSDNLISKMRAAGKAGRKHLYARPGTRAFVRQLSASGCFTLCIYTSMKRSNATASIQAILGDDSKLIQYLLDRNFCRIDPQGTNNWDTMRDMGKVWRLFPQFGLTSTILVDNEARKFRETPLNGIEIPELLRNEISDGSSKVIDSVRNYLLDLGRASPPDVRTYLQQNRFSLPDPVIATTALPVRKDKMVEETVQDLQKLTVNRTGKVGPAATTTTTTTTTPTTVVEKSNNLTSDGGSISPRTRLYVVSVEEMVVVLRDSDGRVVVTAEVDDSKRSIGSSVEYGSLKRVVRVSFVDS